MRRNDRQVTSPEKINEIIGRCKVLRIAMQDKDGLYIVPMNYGYTYENGSLCFYLHSAKEGRKVAAFAETPKVAFELDCGHELTAAEIPCGYGYNFSSVVGSGIVELLTDTNDKINALNLLMQHQTGKTFVFTEQMTEGVNLYRLKATDFTAKQRMK